MAVASSLSFAITNSNFLDLDSCGPHFVMIYGGLRGLAKQVEEICQNAACNFFAYISPATRVTLVPETNV